MDIERKLSVIQEMRREQMRRERENHYPEYRRSVDLRTMGEEKKVNWLWSLQLRFLIAILLFLCFFIMEQKQIRIGEMGSFEITKYIERNILQEE